MRISKHQLGHKLYNTIYEGESKLLLINIHRYLMYKIHRYLMYKTEIL